jgi:hypothetical protein
VLVRVRLRVCGVVVCREPDFVSLVAAAEVLPQEKDVEEERVCAEGKKKNNN